METSEENHTFETQNSKVDKVHHLFKQEMPKTLLNFMEIFQLKNLFIRFYG